MILDQWTDRDPQEHPELSLLKAELFFCMRYEMVCTLLDFFVRRTGLIHFDIKKVICWKNEIVMTMKTNYNWDDERVERELRALNKVLDSITHFR
jgi:glycerol-3-phosphate dehydrogenase